MTEQRTFKCFGGPLDGRLVTVGLVGTTFQFNLPEDPEQVPWDVPTDPSTPWEKKFLTVVTYVLRRRAGHGLCLVWQGLGSDSGDP